MQNIYSSVQCPTKSFKQTSKKIQKNFKNASYPQPESYGCRVILPETLFHFVVEELQNHSPARAKNFRIKQI